MHPAPHGNWPDQCEWKHEALFHSVNPASRLAKATGAAAPNPAKL